MEKAPILDRIKGKIRTYKQIYNYHSYPISKLFFYDTFGRIFYRKKLSSIVALRDFGLKFSSKKIYEGYS